MHLNGMLESYIKSVFLVFLTDFAVFIKYAVFKNLDV